MYRVLLADDEPIILSGLQSFLPWEDYDCTVVGTARNGEQAMEKIRQLRPDIVICDINMPRMTGLEVLRQAGKEWPEAVFIILTNHEDFEKAREALRNNAADYLLKIDLDTEKLVASLAKAKEERQRRGRLRQAEIRPAPVPNRTQELTQWVTQLLSPEGGDPEWAAEELARLGAADRCAVVEMRMAPAQTPNRDTFTRAERERLQSFHYKLVEDLTEKMYYNVGHILVSHNTEVWLYLWGLDGTESLDRLQAKLNSVLGDVSLLQVSFLVSAVVPREHLADLRTQLTVLRSEFADQPKSILRYDAQPMVKMGYVEDAKRYVEAHILDRVTVQGTAAAIGISPNYLSSLFKRQLGQNFVDYVNSRKIRRACILLRSGRHMVYEISHMLGYDNAYYFAKVFKKYMNLTPTEYQAQNSEELPQD